jgi:hypothetical protein
MTEIGFGEEIKTEHLELPETESGPLAPSSWLKILTIGLQCKERGEPRLCKLHAMVPWPFPHTKRSHVPYPRVPDPPLTYGPGQAACLWAPLLPLS